MGSFEIRSRGPLTSPLHGVVEVGGAKNSALKLMAAALLAAGTTTIHNVPEIADIDVMCELLVELGCTVTRDLIEHSVAVDVPDELNHVAPYELVRRLRASIAVLGPLVARCGRASVAVPGGDAIGSRGLDMHVRGLEDLGAKVHVEHGQVIAEAPAGLRGAHVVLDFPSVGATENLLTASVLGMGETTLDNVAREPEIADLCWMLVSMGARIEGIGSSTLTINGVHALQPVEHRTVGDRIVAGTWAYAVALAGGQVDILGSDPRHLDIVHAKLAEAGARLTEVAGGIRIDVSDRPKAVDISTLPYPGFPTDLQPFAIALASVAQGTSMVTENVFEARFMFVQELARLGAEVRTDGHHAVIRGQACLSGAPVASHDIRAGAALALAGLAAEGLTVVSGAEHIDRGYPRFEEVLRSLGADVSRIS